MGSAHVPLASGVLVALLTIPAHARLPGTLNFEDVTAERVIQTVAEVQSNEKHVEVGDIDNDGDLDVAIAVALSDFTSRRNKLYRNDGGVLQEVSGAPVIAGFSDNDVSRTAFLRDYDKDDWLDLIVVNDSNNGGQSGQTKYYANKHPGEVFSHFEDETFRLNGAGGAACSGVSLDLDADSTIDLYLGNYPFNSQDTLYDNDSSGFFTEVTSSSVPPDDDYTVDIAAGDANGDGQIDLLVTNHFDPNYIYYNNNLGAGDGTGDFRTLNSVQQLTGSVNAEPAMEPADFDNDGRLDIYFSNRQGNEDFVFRNTGNDENNHATFDEIPVAGFPSLSESRKATVVDLNADGRQDVIVMGENRRPTVLRNTTVGSFISFVEWTPGHVFSTQHAGWHAAAFDSDGDGFRDILVGGTNDDHLFLNADSNEVQGGALQGVLPGFYNVDPLAVRGRAAAGGTDSYEAADLPAGASVSVVNNGCSDFVLKVRNDQGAIVAASSRGRAGIEEALQLTAPGGPLTFEVTASRVCGDGDGDGDVEGLDLMIFRACVNGALQGAPICRLYDFNRDGETSSADRPGLLNAITEPGATARGTYILELLARS